jgi:hypothetical protein
MAKKLHPSKLANALVGGALTVAGVGLSNPVVIIPGLIVLAIAVAYQEDEE